MDRGTRNRDEPTELDWDTADPDTPKSRPLPAGGGRQTIALHFDKDEGRLIGTVGDELVQLHLVRHHSVTGHIGTVGLDATWTKGRNFVPEPGGSKPSPDYISDFPNVHADLSGSFGDGAADWRPAGRGSAAWAAAT